MVAKKNLVFISVSIKSVYIKFSCHCALTFPLRGETSTLKGYYSPPPTLTILTGTAAGEMPV
jgi:hypothetical protein